MTKEQLAAVLVLGFVLSDIDQSDGEYLRRVKTACEEFGERQRAAGSIPDTLTPEFAAELDAVLLERVIAPALAELGIEVAE